MNKIWLVTGISGCGRIEMLNDFQKFAELKGKHISVYDTGTELKNVAKQNDIKFDDAHILDVDREKLALLRSLAINKILKQISEDTNTEISFIGIHAVFSWKAYILPGVSYSDLLSIDFEGIINIVDDVVKICKANARNPKWSKEPAPNPEITQQWMMEEELLSSIFANVKGKDFFVLARNQSIENLYNFFFSNKKKIYMSYPITAIRNDKELSEKIQKVYLPKLEESFFVYNPLAILDKTHVSEKNKDVDGFLSNRSVELVDARTISRDYRFIEQSDALFVIYPTEKNSPGVLSEITYAYSRQIPVYLYYPYNISPFLAGCTTQIAKTEDELYSMIESIATKQNN